MYLSFSSETKVPKFGGSGFSLKKKRKKTLTTTTPVRRLSSKDSRCFLFFVFFFSPRSICGVHSSTRHLVSHTRSRSINTGRLLQESLLRQQVAKICGVWALTNIRREPKARRGARPVHVCPHLPPLHINRMAGHIWLTAPVFTDDMSYCSVVCLYSPLCSLGAGFGFFSRHFLVKLMCSSI